MARALGVVCSTPKIKPEIYWFPSWVLEPTWGSIQEEIDEGRCGGVIIGPAPSKVLVTWWVKGQDDAFTFLRWAHNELILTGRAITQDNAPLQSDAVPFL